MPHSDDEVAATVADYVESAYSPNNKWIWLMEHIRSGEYPFPEPLHGESLLVYLRRYLATTPNDPILQDDLLGFVEYEKAVDAGEV